MSFRRPTPVQWFLLCMLLLAAIRTPDAESQIEGGRCYSVRVHRVYDGDTFETTDGQRIRLLGIDSPEVKHRNVPAEFYGPESGTWLRSLILGTRVRLEEGVVSTDRYGRTLAWVFLSDGRLVNRLALESGNARLLSRFGLPLHLEDELRNAESLAKSECRGLWNVVARQSALP